MINHELHQRTWERNQAKLEFIVWIADHIGWPPVWAALGFLGGFQHLDETISAWRNHIQSDTKEHFYFLFWMQLSDRYTTMLREQDGNINCTFSRCLSPQSLDIYHQRFDNWEL